MIRGIGLRGAIAVNVITMIGIGPLITIPLVLTHLHGSLALVAWVVGALIALCDGLVWAELGSRYPGSGGTYVFLREAFGAQRLGRMLAFLFTWQTVLAVPLLLASGYIGFAQYAAYLWPALDTPLVQGVVAAAVALVTVVLLYRPIGNVARISIGFGVVAVATLVIVILASAAHFTAAQAVASDPHVPVTSALLAGLGPALIITLYDYSGYGQVCFVGDEVREPRRILPLAIVASLAIVGALYALLQVGVLGSVPWTSLVASVPGGTPPATAMYVASTVVEHGWGVWAARIATVAILVTAFASTFGNLLGFSRIPFAAARDGVFLRWFGTLHPSGKFPNVSLVVIGLLAVPFCFFTLEHVIEWLTAAIILIQNLGQIAALLALRLRGERAPYRMWLFPLPLVAATAAWIWIFYSAGGYAIAYGLLTLLAGAIVYLVMARLQRQWPFVVVPAALVLAFLCFAGPVRAAQAETPLPAQTFTHAAIVERDGNPVFEVDGKPFFVYGAAFFYERLPRSEWARSMRALRSLGINTLDLYVIWNWHELSDGNYDFIGRTSPRRDLRYLLKLARQNGFKLIVRPGPVIRNEWRNGGYPAWLLSRPEYGMPLHDLLEGRYPPTATLQNAHSDDAAAQWMRNATHMRYSARWIRRALEEFRPYADLVLAVQLDDDQGAYLDNQTWPAPHLRAYLNHLKAVVHSVTGPLEPVFINTYQMKVTASSPVWAMGNWYQSDAYLIGEHDRAQLEFSTGLLQTRPHQPLMYSEFQAGWLLGPDDIRPRPADPSNTLLAMATLLGMGVRGIVNFPAQDTLYPTGWEAPFANWFYAWDAALTLGDGDRDQEFAPETWESPGVQDGRRGYRRQTRAVQTKTVGDWAANFGPALARAAPAWDAAILYPFDAFDGSSNPSAEASAQAVQQTQQWCRRDSLACRLVDLRYARAVDPRDGLVMLVPSATNSARLHPRVKAALVNFVASGGILVSVRRWSDFQAVDSALRRVHRRRRVDALPGASLLLTPGGSQSGFLVVPNYGSAPLKADNVVLRFAGTTVTLPRVRIPARDAKLIRLNVPLDDYHPAFPHDVRVLAADCVLKTEVFRENDHALAKLIATPNADGCHVELRGDQKTQSLTFGENGGEVFRAPAGPPPPGPFFGDAVSYGRFLKTVPIRRDTSLVYYQGFFCAADDNVAPGHPLRVQQGRERSLCEDPLVGAGESTVRSADVYAEGGGSGIILENALVRLVVAPNAGARVFALEDKRLHTSVFTSVGALRDDVRIEPPLSKTDRIAKYTHSFPAGMFNRPYQSETLESGRRAVIRFTYDAPDVEPAGAHFEKTVTLEPDLRSFVMDERVTFNGDAARAGQRAVSVTSLAVGDSSKMATQAVLAPDPSRFAPNKVLGVTGNALGFYDTATHELATIAWRPGDVEDAKILERRYSILTRLTLDPARIARIAYGYYFVDTLDAARAKLAERGSALQGQRPEPMRTEAR